MAFVFARLQFARSLRFDEDSRSAAAPPAAIAETAPVRSWSDRFYRIPALLFSDPLAALIEKELRFLSRAPRFRLILLLACTLGPVVWLPLAFGKQSASNTVFASNYLTFTSVYALLVLGDNLFWNAFGFDRSAAQTFFVTPVRFSSVLIAKNIVATFFVFVVMAAGTVFCLLLRLPVGGEKMLEAYAVTCVYAILVLAVGNLSSVYHPRAVDPGQAWKNTAGRVQVFLLLLYPILGVPLMLAYGARYAFDSQAAFYGVLAIDFAIGLVVYWIALESCLEAVAKDREKMVSALSQSEGPIAVS